MKLVLCATLLAATALTACASGGGHGYYYQGHHWDRREKVCDVKPNGRKVCTWRYF